MKVLWEEMKKRLEEKLLASLDYSREASDEEVETLLDDLFLREEELRFWTVGERRSSARKFSFP